MATKLPRASSSLTEWACSLAAPIVEALALVLACYVNNERFDGPEFILMVLAFSLAFPGRVRFGMPLIGVFLREVGGFAVKLVLLFSLALITGAGDQFDRESIITWILWTPIALVLTHQLLQYTLPKLGSLKGFRSAVIVGMTATGRELSETIEVEKFLGIKLLGFFDDRKHDRIAIDAIDGVLGRLVDVAPFAKAHNVDAIIITLPMSHQSRIVELLSALRDTTASIYFAPDVFTFDIIQGRTTDIAGIPIVAVCETPFYGMAAVIKRMMDLVGALMALLILLPFMLAIAVAIRISSPGPVLFRQRRYGCDGKEIVIYKFRSMSVMEDGGVVHQAHRNDRRVTPVGAFLRRNSLDELPQLINVIQGRMSLVGPRPHAIAHNETYRAAIKGYMIRHKVKPGMTGWAQVNGARGETDTVEKMERRVRYDLEYLRNWSVRFDIYILFRTVPVVLRQEAAY